MKKLFFALLILIAVLSQARASDASNAYEAASSFDFSLGDTLAESSGFDSLGKMIGFTVNSEEVIIYVSYITYEGKARIAKCIKNTKTGDEVFTDLKTGKSL